MEQRRDGSRRGKRGGRRGRGGRGGGPDTRAVVRLSGPDDVIGILPWRLGFHPTESLVLVVLQGSRRRERLVMRLDLPAPDDEPAVAADTATKAVQAEADEVLLVVYTDEPRPDGGLPRCDLVDDLVDLLADDGVDVPEAVLVSGGRRWSYLCADPRCCTPEGVPLPDRPTPAADAYAAEAVVRGTVVLPDRDALRRSVTPSDHPVAVAVREQAWDELDRLLTSRDLAAASADLLARLRARFARGHRDEPSPAEALLVALGLRDAVARDALMTAALDDDATEVRDLVGQVARLVDDEVAAPVCTVLGWLAYTSGEGALALVAVERALSAEPGCTMAQLLLGGIDGMVPPSALRDVSRAVRADLSVDGR
jgi:hypothetical protein